MHEKLSNLTVIFTAFFAAVAQAVISVCQIFNYRMGQIATSICQIVIGNKHKMRNDGITLLFQKNSILGSSFSQERGGIKWIN